MNFSFDPSFHNLKVPKSGSRGYTLVEMVVYIFMFTLLLLVIINVLSAVLNSQKSLKASKNVETAAVTAFERMTREIRNAKSISFAGANDLALNTTDSVGNPKTVEFFASSTVLSLRENGVYSGPITSTNVSVSNLVFYSLDSVNSKAVRIVATFQSGAGSSAKSSTFYSTVILRGTY